MQQLIQNYNKREANFIIDIIWLNKKSLSQKLSTIESNEINNSSITDKTIFLANVWYYCILLCVWVRRCFNGWLTLSLVLFGENCWQTLARKGLSDTNFNERRALITVHSALLSCLCHWKAYQKTRDVETTEQNFGFDNKNNNNLWYLCT